MELDYIKCGNSEELLKELPDNSIDLVVTSPPYDNLRSCKGFVFPFENIAKELYQVVKEGGCVIWVVGDQTINGSETLTSFKQALYFKELGFRVHDTMLFRKKNYAPQTRNRYEQEFEYMFCFSKGKPKCFTPIKIPCKYAGQPTWGTRTFYSTKKDETTATHHSRTINDTKQHGNIFEYRVGSTTSSAKVKHPAMFPIELAIDQINSWSNEGDVVLDPFMGSGTVALASIRTNRHYIGFDISEEYCEIARKRIEEEKGEQISFL